MNILQLFGCITLLSGIVVVAGGSQAASQTARLKEREAEFYHLDFGRSLVRDRPSNEFVDLTFEAIPTELVDQMYSYLAFSVHWAAHPQKQGEGRVGGDFRVRAYAAHGKTEDDLIEYAWTRFGQDLRLVAGLNAMRLDINLGDVLRNREMDDYGSNAVARTKGLLSQILRLAGVDRDGRSFEVYLPWPEELVEGTRFCSNLDTNLIRMKKWHERVDVYVHDGILSVLIYKKVEQLIGYQDGSTWFPSEFRELVHRKAEKQAKAGQSESVSKE